MGKRLKKKKLENVTEPKGCRIDFTFSCATNFLSYSWGFFSFGYNSLIKYIKIFLSTRKTFENFTDFLTEFCFLSFYSMDSSSLSNMSFPSLLVIKTGLHYL